MNSLQKPAVLAMMFSICACAQDATGSIRGVVSDPAGASVPNATVTVTNSDKNTVVRTFSTGPEGSYSAPLLSVGHYSVKAEAAGFAPYTVAAINLNVNDTLTVDLHMRLGDLAAAVTVSADAVTIDTETPTAAGLISGAQVRELSINNRNYEQLVALVPGVSSGVADQIYVGVSNPSGSSNQINFSINGNRPTQNNWTIDGADNVDRGANLTLLNYPSIDSIEEFKVLRGQYNPEFGRSSAGQINVVTRSGGNTFHGSAYEFFRNDKLDANNFFNNKNGIGRPPLRHNDFGGTIGGPVYIPGFYNTNKDKTFFFFSEEARRIITYTTFQSGEVPTPAELQGTFPAAVCLNAACTSTGTQVTNIDPTAQAYIKDIFAKLPTPGSARTLNFVGRNLFNFRQETLRVDHYFSQKFNLMGRWLNDSIPTEEPGGLFTGSGLPGVATTRTNSPGHNFTIRATYTFTPTLVNEGGYNYSYGAVLSTPIGFDSRKLSPDINPSLPFAVQVPRVPDLAFNDGEGVYGFGSYLDYNRNHALFDTLSWVKGQHSIKFGITYNRYQKDENSGGTNTGQYSFLDASPNGNGPSDGTYQQEFANFLEGNVATFSQLHVDPRAVINQNQLEVFAQDAWRIRRNLTISYGARYSLFLQPTEGRGNLASFDPSLYSAAKAPAIDPASGNLAAGTATPVVNGLSINNSSSPYGGAIASTPKTNLAPRLGIAWDPFGDGKTSIRTGYGIFYDSPSVGVVEQNVLNNPPYVGNSVFSNTLLSSPGGVSQDVNLAPLALYATQPHWKQPYTQEWSFDIQRQLAGNFTIDAGYYGGKGTHLIGVVDINQPQPLAYLAAGIVAPGKFITGGTTPLLNSIRPYLGFDAINMFSPRFDSNYNSLQAQVQKRLQGNSLIVVNYTWSHALTDSQGDYTTPQNSYNFRAEYGPTQFDRRQILTLNYVYEIPFLKAQKGFAGHVLGGWELSGITTYETGLPLTVTGGRRVDPLGLGLLDPQSFSGRRPDEVGSPSQGAPHTIAKWFNTGAFANIPDGAYHAGDSPRGAVRGPGIARWDISLFKNTKLFERLNTQFRAESFNTFNHTNYNAVSTSLASSLFGQVLSTRDPRVIQLAMKIVF